MRTQNEKNGWRVVAILERSFLTGRSASLSAVSFLQHILRLERQAGASVTRRPLHLCVWRRGIVSHASFSLWAFSVSLCASAHPQAGHTSPLSLLSLVVPLPLSTSVWLPP